MNIFGRIKLKFYSIKFNCGLLSKSWCSKRGCCDTLIISWHFIIYIFPPSSLNCSDSVIYFYVIVLKWTTDKPKARLGADNTAVPIGGSVTLNCSVSPSSSSSSSSRWKYYWYRNEKYFQPLTTQDAVFQSHAGLSSATNLRPTQQVRMFAKNNKNSFFQGVSSVSSSDRLSKV